MLRQGTEDGVIVRIVEHMSGELVGDGLFADGPAHAFQQLHALAAVAEMASKGIINGYEDGSFRPKNTLTRAETAVVIYKIMTEVYANE